MKHYNGFTPAQRQRVGDWLRAEFAAGRLKRPRVCRACGQDKGIIDTHQEDYGEPYGPHLIDMPLCFRCHMIVHCRFANRSAFEFYVREIMKGVRYAAMYRRDWRAFVTQHLENFGRGVPCEQHDPPREDLLSAIECGAYDPRRKGKHVAGDSR